MAILTQPELWQIVGLSLYVSGGAVLLASLCGIPLGASLAVYRFPGSGLLATVLDAFMGLPPVVAGLLVYLLFSRSGPFGVLDLLYTPAVMIIAQFLLALPIVAALTRAAVASKDRLVRETAQSLGATGPQVIYTVLREARGPLLGAVLAGLGRALAEVGAVMIVGGNIEGKTRVMTTAIVLETRQGNFDTAIALGAVLLVVSFLLTFTLNRLGDVR